MATRTCPDCDAQYLATVRRCIDCDTLLVDENSDEPTSAAVRGIDDEHGTIRLTLDGWGNQLKVTLDGMLQRQRVPHVWEAGDLVVAATHREELAELVDAVEGREVEVDDAALLALEIEDLDPDHRELLDARLLAAGLDHAWSDDGALLVDIAAEVQVIEIVEGLFDDTPDHEAEDVTERLSELFVAVDRLVKRIGDERAEQSYRDAVTALDPATVPYGFDADDWRQLVGSAEALAMATDRSHPDDADAVEARPTDEPDEVGREAAGGPDRAAEPNEPESDADEGSRQDRLLTLRDRLRDLV